MAQNLKIILENTNNKVQNNVLFGDTITIKGDSKIALTSFNATFDVSKIGNFISNQSFDFYTNFDPSINLPAVNVVLPDKTYFNIEELNEDMITIINKSFSSFEIGNVGNQLNNLGLTFTLDAQTNGNTSLILEAYKLTDVPINVYLFNPNINLDINDLSYLDSADDVDIELNLTSTPLLKGGGVWLQFNEKFNTSNFNSLSVVKITSPNGDYMSLNYKTISTAVFPIVEFFVEVKENNVISKVNISNDFYNWNTSINTNKIKPLEGPWKATGATFKNSFFGFYQKNNKWSIVYYDANNNTFIDMFTNGLTYKHTINYTVAKKLTGFKKNIQFNVEQFKGVFSDKATSIVRSSKFDFNNCDSLINIYGISKTALLLPANSQTTTYKGINSIQLYIVENFEIACEVDIKIKNYVGNSSNKINKNNGRKNIIAYFTPEFSLKSLATNVNIYRYEPSNPIYLSIDNKDDIDLNSINIRFYNSYNNEGFKADSLTCVLTNM